MDTKRLFRLIVTPGALAYAVLGFLTGLLWLSLSAQPTTLTEGPRPITSSPTGRVSLQDAIDSARRFSGDSSLVLEGGLEADADGGSRSSLYYLETVSPTRGEDIFKVDARTAEVVEATYRGRLAPSQGAADLPLAEAEVLARRYARTHFWGFDQLRLVDRSTRTGDTGTVHSFKWSLIAPESGAELPTSVSLAVSARSGQVFWYLGQRDPVQVDTNPLIQREQAVETARGWLLSRDERWDLAEPASVRLQVLYDDDDRQQLVWSVVFRARQAGPRQTLRLLVDAENGQLIQSAA